MTNIVNAAQTQPPAYASSGVLSVAAMTTVQMVLARGGWEISFLDVNLSGTGPIVDMKVHRADGRWLWARIDALGRCSLTRYHRETYLGQSRAYGAMAPRCTQHDDLFLGRTRLASPRGLLVHLVRYVSENALHPLSVREVRRAVVEVLAAPAVAGPLRITRDECVVD